MAVTKVNGAERAFREETIRVLSKLDTQMDELMRDRDVQKQTVLAVATELRDVTSQKAAELRAEFHEHNAQDDANFAEMRAKHSRMERLLNWGVGGLAVIQFGIGIGVVIWSARH